MMPPVEIKGTISRNRGRFITMIDQRLVRKRAVLGRLLDGEQRLGAHSDLTGPVFDEHGCFARLIVGRDYGSP